MNKISGYVEFPLLSGRIIKLKYGNGAAEMYAKMQGFTTVGQINSSLQFDSVPVLDDEGNVVLDSEGKTVVKYDMPVDMLVAVRRMVYCAAKYVCLREGTEVDFDEYDAGEWAEEIGFDLIFGSLDEPPQSEQSDPKKKAKQVKKPLIRPTQ